MDKKIVLEFLNSIETYSKVLKIVEDECQNNDTHLGVYPKDYFIAGGSIANTIHHLFNLESSKKPIINDIDLFFFNHVNRSRWYYQTTENGSFIHEEINQVPNIDGYGRIWLGSNGEEIRMVSSERFGVINKVTIDVNLWQKEFVTTDYHIQLLNNFDLNCCMAGLDRVNNKIIFTDKFVEFLSTNKIEVTGIAHPLQTAVRMKKKSEELLTDTSGFSIEMSLLQHSFILHYSRAIGPEWIEKSKKYNSFLDQYFTVDERNHPIPVGVELFHYVPKNFTMVPYSDQFSFKTYKSLIGFWDNFVRVKSPEKSNKILTFYTQHRGLITNKPNTTFKDSFGMIRVGSAKVVNNVYDFIDCLGISPNYFDCDFSVDDLIEIDNFFKFVYENLFDLHTYIVGNVKDQLKFIEYFNKKFVGGDGLIKRDLLNKTISYSYTNSKYKIDLGSNDVNRKINTLNKLVNNRWLGNKGSNYYKFKFLKKKKTINLNDLDYWG